MSRYYFLATSLPALQLGVPPEISWEELMRILQENLSPADMERVEALKRWYDVQNLRAYWEKLPIDPRGNLDKLRLEEAIVSRDLLPSYVNSYLDEYPDDAQRLKHFPKLVTDYLTDEALDHVGFLRQYINFEHDWRLVMMGLRSKMIGRDLLQELQYEDTNNPVVDSLIAQKDAKEYLPPIEYQDLATLYQQNREEPLQLFQALTRYRFDKIAEIVGLDMFSMRAILGYVVQYQLASQYVQCTVSH